MLVKIQRSFFVLLILALSACSSGTPLLRPAPTEFTFPTRTATLPVTATFVPPTVTSTPTPPPRPTAKRVLIISFDGLRPDAIALAPMENLLALMKVSAYSLQAQTIVPSSTLPAHTSMLDGVCPIKHGVFWDEYLPEKGYAPGVDLFDLAHDAGLRTVMIVGKEKLRQISEPSSTDVFVFTDKSDADLAQHAVDEIGKGFGLMFVHFPFGDLQGHEFGWLSEQQFAALRSGDAALGQILAALDANGLRESTLIIVTADHGGYKTSHGGFRPEETTIPWIASGPFIQPGELTSYIVTTDTAATAAYVLGFSPTGWDGLPVLDAFGFPPQERTNVCRF
jgi:hypothetical protein